MKVRRWWWRWRRVDKPNTWILIVTVSYDYADYGRTSEEIVAGHLTKHSQPSIITLIKTGT